MFRLPETPSAALNVRSDDPDEVTAWAAARDGFHSRVVHGTGRYGFRASSIIGTHTALCWSRTAKEHTVRGCFGTATVHVSTGPIQHYFFGRRSMTVQPGQPVFIAPGVEAGRRAGPGAVFGMDIDAAALQRELQMRASEGCGAWQLMPVELVMDPSVRESAEDAILRLTRAFENGAAPNLVAHCESAVVGVIADALLRRRRTTNTGSIAAQRLADLEAWIDAHLAEPMTIGRLCGVAGIGERSLQLAFQGRRGMSPMRFVIERRLTAAHRKLMSLAGTADVTSVAHDLGFTHLGRYSLAYSRTFGEAPSRTRARGRQMAERQSNTSCQ